MASGGSEARLATSKGMEQSEKEGPLQLPPPAKISFDCLCSGKLFFLHEGSSFAHYIVLVWLSFSTWDILLQSLMALKVYLENQQFLLQNFAVINEVHFST